MHEFVWTKEYEVNAALINPQKKLGLYALLNLLQDIAWEHAQQLKHGYDDLQKDNLIWVLIRQKLSMNLWPQWGEVVRINTWLRPQYGILVNRDFEIYLDEKLIGACTTAWLTLNSETRKPTKIDLNSRQNNCCRKDYCLDLAVPKIKLLDDLENQVKFQVRNSDLDVHLHVNNTRYALWILDSMPLAVYEHFTLKEYAVNFLVETKIGDVITIQKGSPTAISLSASEVQYQGWREADNKVVFSAMCKILASAQ